MGKLARAVAVPAAMTKRSLFCLLVFCQVAIARPAEPVDALMHDRLADIRVGADCDRGGNLLRTFCPAAAFETGTAAPLPAGHVLLGLGVRIKTGEDFATAFNRLVTFDAWAVGTDGTVKLTTVRPSNDEERTDTMRAVMSLSALFKGRAHDAPMPAELASYVRTLHGAHPATRTNGEWRWDDGSPGRARKVGDYWVVIEPLPDNAGIWATVLTDAWH